MIQHDDMLTFSLVYDRYGEVAPYHQARATLSDDNGEIYPYGITMGWVNLNPIPLTDDWLIKAGFRQYDGGWCRGKVAVIDGRVMIEEKDFSDDLIPNARVWAHKLKNLTVIEYVHDLQRAWFELTGEEIEIDYCGR